VVGTIATITPYSHSRAGRVATVRIVDSNGELILRGEDLRKAVGYTVIPSTQFAVEFIGQDVVISGYGAGHAVGLCQWGAKELAELGYSFSSILGYYYPGTELRDASLTQAPPAPSVPSS
jgi:stage II sporulation protein D